MAVAASEPIARYLTSSGQFAATKGTVKRSALMPAKDNKTSVFRTGGLSEDGVAAIGRREVGADRPLYGWGEVCASAVFEVGLDLEPDDVPPRHANIIGWPADKSEVIERAQELAAKGWELKLLQSD
jgi:hypothetical protein